MARSKLKVGNIQEVSGEVNIAAGDIIKNIKTIHQRALTAAEEAARARKLENKLLAQGIATLVQNLSSQASEGIQSDSPYKGLLPYSLNEAEIFYGRDKAKKDLLVHIKQSQLTVLHAESGAGKSSLLQAGIAAQLIANGHLAVYLRPYHADPVEFIKRMFLPELTQAPALASASLREFLRQVCAVLGPKINLYLLLDQFEEFFQLKKEERQPFLESLTDCLNDPSLKVRWVLALRKEALSDLAELESFGITQFKNTYRLNRLSRAEAQEAMIEPARHHGITFEPALIEHILDTLTTNDEVRPTHLQLVCSALTDDLPDVKTLTLAYYTEQEGGTEGILRDYLKRQLEDLPAGEQALAWKVLRALITADRHRAVKTNDQLIQELKTSGVTKKQIETILGRLVERRLLFTQTQPATEEVFELAHDYLIKEIELDPQEQALKAAQELLDQETRTYLRHKTLLTAERLAVIEPYRNVLRVSPDAEVLLSESRKAVQAEQRARERRRNLTLGVSVAVAIGMSLLALWGLRSSQAARQQVIVSRAGELAAQSVALRDQDFRLSLLLGVEAFRLQPENIQARGALRDAANAYPQLLQFLTGYSERGWSAAFSPDGKLIASGHVGGSIVLWDVKTGKPIGKALGGHMRTTPIVAFSADNRLLASVGEDGIVILWDVASQKQVGQIPKEQAGSVSNIAFSPTGHMLATSGEKLILWDVPSDQQIAQLAVVLTEQGSSYVAFSPDGRLLASVTGGIGDHAILVWDVASHQPIGQTLRVGQNFIYDLAFNKDDQTLALAGDNITLWNIASSQPIGQTLIGQSGVAYSLAFSPDGKTLASGSDEHPISLWDVASRKRISLLTGHTYFVSTVAFSPDGKTLVSAGADNTLRLWTVASRHQVIGRTLSGFTKSASSVVFNPDGKMLASIGEDQTIILWHIASSPNTGQWLTGHAKGVTSIVFSPDGKMLASNGCEDSSPSGACKRGEIILWDVASRKQVGPPLIGDTASITSVAFSPDGKMLASSSCGEFHPSGACKQGEIILWDVASRQPMGLPLTGHTDGVKSVAFSPDGKILASGSYDNTIILWDVASRQPIGQPLKGHTDSVNSVAFSPDGKMLASGTVEENIIFLWNIASSQPSGQPLTGHTDLIFSYSVAFSPDNRTLASVGGYQLILWDVPSRQQIGQTITSQGGFDSVAFSPNGKTLATGGSILTLWDLDPLSWVKQACQRAGGNFTLVEWERYFPNEKYHRTCDQWPPAPESTPAPSAAP